MTQPVNANAAPHSSWETDVSVPSESQSSTSFPPSPAGVKSCWADIQLITGRRWDSCFNFGFTTLHFKQHHPKLWVVLMAEPFLSRFVSCPWKIQQELLKINHMTIRRQSLDFVSCIAVGYTCNSADKCIFLNHCFYLKSLRLAPNFCWRYTMSYLNIFMHTHKNITHEQLKKSHRDKMNSLFFLFVCFFFTFSVNLPLRYL